MLPVSEETHLNSLFSLNSKVLKDFDFMIIYFFCCITLVIIAFFVIMIITYSSQTYTTLHLCDLSVIINTNIVWIVVSDVSVRNVFHLTILEKFISN